MHSIAIVGFGDLGQRLYHRLDASRWRCYGLRRNTSALPAGVIPVAVDLQEPESLQVLAELCPDALLVALSPAQRSPDAYRAGFQVAMETILRGLGEHRPRQAFFVSSTRVYAENGGAWIDEDSALAHDDPHAAAIIAAERSFLDALPGARVLRAAGLYGEAPGFLLKRVAAGQLSPRTPRRYTNRIHRDDVLGFIAQSLGSFPSSAPARRVTNLVDTAPVAIQEIEEWLCGQLGKPYEPPQEAVPDSVVRHKRIRSLGLAQSVYSLRYPDYRTGYAAALRQWLAHSEG